MQEGDVQIKGYPVRLPLDVLLAFTANPEDYTARGKIITPLKDRIGSEIITHYPRTVELGHGDHRAGGLDRARTAAGAGLPDFVPELVERVAFEAREDKRVDKRSGVSQRLPISVLENAVSNAERRALAARASRRWCPGSSDVYAALPSITGKLELEYEGELQGGETIAQELIRRAAGHTLEERLGERRSRRDRGLVRPGRRAQDHGRRAERALPQGVRRGARAARRRGGRARWPSGMIARCWSPPASWSSKDSRPQKRISRTEELGYTRAKPERRDPRVGGQGVRPRVSPAGPSASRRPAPGRWFVLGLSPPKRPGRTRGVRSPLL